MKVLWLCNTLFTETSIKGNGSWLQPLAEAIQKTGDVEILNITSGSVKQTEQKNYNGILQWVIPKDGTTKHGQIANKNTCLLVSSIIDQEKPDLVHIWGTESFWASVYRQNYIKCKVLIDIQGLLFAYESYYYGGLSISEILKSIYVKEILMPWRTLFFKKRIFYNRGVEEKKNLSKLQHISYQSIWVKNQVHQLNPNARFYETKIMLRKNFYDTQQWKFKNNTSFPIVFSSCSASVTYKGLHILIRAVHMLKKKYPNILLRLAGNINVGNKLKDGYSLFLTKLIKELELQENVIYCGSLNENQLIEELLQSNVCVVPSFVESYCLALAEAMIVGVPTVASYAGAMPELAEHRKEALFYNSLDSVTCAAYIDELIQNQDLAEAISDKARQRRLIENNQSDVLSNQLSIYKTIIQGD